MSKPLVMHIIGVLAPHGAERAMLNICLGLRDRYTPMVVAFRGGAMEEVLNGEGIPCVTMMGQDQDAGLWSRFWFCWVNMKRHKPDLVHTHYEYGNVLGRIAAHLQGIPSVAHFRGVERLSGTALYRIAHRIASLGHTRLVAVSNGLAQQVQSTTGLSPLTIYDSVDEERLRVGSCSPGSFRKELAVDPDAFLIGTVGRVEAVKNYPALLRCAQRVCTARDDVHFVCVGGGGLLDDMLRLRDELGLANRVHFLGYRDDVGSILQDVNAFCFMSRGEGLPWSVIEAMLMECPVVATNVRGVNEVVRDGLDGFLVDDDDDEAAAERLLMLYDDRPLLRAFSEAARCRARTAFNRAAMLEETGRIYEELLRGVE